MGHINGGDDDLELARSRTRTKRNWEDIAAHDEGQSQISLTDCDDSPLNPPALQCPSSSRPWPRALVESKSSIIVVDALPRRRPHLLLARSVRLSTTTTTTTMTSHPVPFSMSTGLPAPSSTGARVRHPNLLVFTPLPANRSHRNPCQTRWPNDDNLLRPR